jgi:hypothetical protein
MTLRRIATTAAALPAAAGCLWLAPHLWNAIVGLVAGI